MNISVQTKTRNHAMEKREGNQENLSKKSTKQKDELGTADESDTKKHAGRKKCKTGKKKRLRSSSNTAGACPEPKRDKRRKH